LTILTGHAGCVEALAFMADGSMLVSGSADTTALLWDVAAFTTKKPKPGKLTETQLRQAWMDLAETNAMAGYRAVTTLTGHPDQAVPFLKKQLLGNPSSKLVQLIADLDSPKYPVRQKATKELLALGPSAESALQQCLNKSPSLEHHLRVKELLGKIQNWKSNSETVQLWRATEVLAAIDTAEARQLLKTVAYLLPPVAN
jgi:hypothetical protein